MCKPSAIIEHSLFCLNQSQYLFPCQSLGDKGAANRLDSQGSKAAILQINALQAGASENSVKERLFESNSPGKGVLQKRLTQSC